MGAHHLHELAAFTLCEKLMKAIAAATASGRVARDFEFCDQINGAATDAAADVAEGWVRYYPREFARFLDYALSSLEEVRVRTESGYTRKYFTAETTSDILQLHARSDKAARGLRAYLWTVKKDDLPPRPNRTRPPHIRTSRHRGASTKSRAAFSKRIPG